MTKISCAGVTAAVLEYGKTHLFSESVIPLFIAEFVGTALLLFLGCMGCIVEAAGLPTAHHMPSIAFGLVVMVIVQIFGHISGAHLNPAVTLATVILGQFKYFKAITYVTAQFAGAIFGFGLLKLLVPEEYAATEVFSAERNETIRRFGICSTVPNPKLEGYQAASIEAIITGVLILLCCAVWDQRNSTKLDSVALKFGFTIAAVSLAAAPFTSASLNTARTFAPALLNGDWDHHWVYWIGPNAGAVVATLFYKYLYSMPTETEEEPELHQLETVRDNVENKQ